MKLRTWTLLTIPAALIVAGCTTTAVEPVDPGPPPTLGRRPG